jgi:hypothetical protein
MWQCPSGESARSDRTVAVTAIEHRDIVITVASLIRKSEPSPSSVADSMFVTMILGGPQGGETSEGKSWSTMIRNHAGAVSRVAEFITAQQDR